MWSVSAPDSQRVLVGFGQRHAQQQEGGARSRAQNSAVLGDERSVGCVKWMLRVLGVDPAVLLEVGAGAG